MDSTEKNPIRANKRKQFLRSKFIKSGAHELSEYELLELLLGYSPAECDARELSHTLIDYFGSLESVLRSDAPALCEAGETDDETALLISIIGKVSHEASVRPSFLRTDFDSKEDSERFFCEYFEVEQRECLMALFIDCRGNPISAERISEGTVNLTEVSVALIARKAMRLGAAGVILAHNHPHGEDISEEDRATTLRLRDTLYSLGITLHEHYVISKGKALGILAAIEAYSFGCISVRSVSGEETGKENKK